VCGETSVASMLTDHALSLWSTWRPLETYVKCTAAFFSLFPTISHNEVSHHKGQVRVTDGRSALAVSISSIVHDA